MAWRHSWVLAGFLLLGCGRSPSPFAFYMHGAPEAFVRLQATSGLVLRCSHVVLGKEEICGVLTVQNTRDQDIALVCRWNSWGAYQWTMTIGSQSAQNPQFAWYRNGYTESLIRRGETRHAWFSVTPTYQPDELRKGAWRFTVRDPFHRTMNESLKEVDSFTPFGAGQPLVVRFEGIQPFDPTPAGSLPAALWTGTEMVQSTEVKTLQALEALAQGTPLP